MDELWRNVGSLSWWVGVVVVGLLVNVIAAYLKPTLDFILSRVSTRWALRSEKLTAERAARIALIRVNNTEKVLSALREIRHSILALIIFGQGLFFVLMGQTVLSRVMHSGTPVIIFGISVYKTVFHIVGTMALLAMIFSMNFFWTAKREHDELSEAYELPLVSTRELATESSKHLSSSGEMTTTEKE